MDPADIPRLVYLGLLLLFVGGGVILALRNRAATALSHAAIWVLIFLGVIAAAGLWPEIRAAVAPAQRVLAAESGAPVVEVPRSRDGHYYLELEIAGMPVFFTVDTGATDIVLSRSDAEAVGIEPDDLAYLGTAFTANGAVRTARVTLPDVTLGSLTDRDVPAVVTDGDLGFSLLGMAYLNRFARIEIADGRLILTR